MHTTNPSTPDNETIKTRQQATWASGDFGCIGVRLQFVGESLCQAMDLHPAQRSGASSDQPARASATPADLPSASAFRNTRDGREKDVIAYPSARRTVMTPKARRPWFPVILLSVALAALSSCGSDKGSSPTGPGTAKELDSGDFGSAATYQHRFAVAGTFPYRCVHHAPMTGSVEVSAGAADSLVNVNIASSTMSFPAASVKPGGRVVWTNNTGVVHTVTSN